MWDMRTLKRARGYLLATICATVLASPAHVRGENLQARTTVNVNVVSCEVDMDRIPVVKVGPSYLGPLVGASIISRTKTGKTWQVRLMASSIHFWISITTPHCHTEMAITAMQSHARQIIAVMGNRGLSSEGTGWLYGLVPKGTFSVYLVMPGTYRLVEVATIDGGAYYFEDLPPNNYVLRVEVGPGNLRDYDIRSTNNGGRRFDVTPQMLIETGTMPPFGPG